MNTSLRAQLKNTLHPEAIYKKLETSESLTWVVLPGTILELFLKTKLEAFSDPHLSHQRIQFGSQADSKVRIQNQKKVKMFKKLCAPRWQDDGLPGQYFWCFGRGYPAEPAELGWSLPTPKIRLWVLVIGVGPSKYIWVGSSPHSLPMPWRSEDCHGDRISFPNTCLEHVQIESFGTRRVQKLCFLVLRSSENTCKTKKAIA